MQRTLAEQSAVLPGQRLADMERTATKAAFLAAQAWA